MERHSIRLGVELLMQELDPHGLMMRVGVATPEMADDLVKSVAKWTRTRPSLGGSA